MNLHTPTTIRPQAILLRSALGAAMCLASATAMAGRSGYNPVSVQLQPDGSGMASGDTRTARRSANTIEEIGCSMTASELVAGDPNSVRFTGSCTARDASGRSKTCVTRNRRLLEIAHNATSYAFIRFAWRADGTCHSLLYSHTSSVLP